MPGLQGKFQAGGMQSGMLSDSMVFEATWLVEITWGVSKERGKVRALGREGEKVDVRESQTGASEAPSK